jgi:stage II sporulation protein E
MVSFERRRVLDLLMQRAATHLKTLLSVTALCAVSFCCARAGLVSMRVRPFAMAAALGALGVFGPALGAGMALCAALGCVLSGDLWGAVAVAGAVVVRFVMPQRPQAQERRFWGQTPLTLSALLLHTVSRLPTAAAPFDLLVLPLSVSLCAVLAPLYQDAFAALCDAGALSERDHRVSLCVLAASCVLGLCDLTAVSLRPAGILCAFCAAGMGLVGGSGAGAACGALLGAVLSAADPAYAWSCAALTLGGFCAGAFRDCGKFYGCGAFLLGALWMLFLANAPAWYGALELMIGMAPWLIVPKSALQQLKEALCPPQPGGLTGERMRAVRTAALTRLNALIPVVFSLAGAYEQRAHQPTEQLSTCFGCSWQQSCARTPEACARAMETERQMWMEKMQKQAALSMGSQLRAVGEVMAAAAQSLGNRFELDREATAALTKRLQSAGMAVHDVLVARENDQLTVHLTARACGGSRRCEQKLAPLVSQSVGQAMQVTHLGCISRQGRCVLRFEPVEQYALSIGVARRAAQGKTRCGDAYAFGRLDGGRFYLVLSDGMGTGSAANSLSTRTVSLVEDYLAAGFPLPLAAQSANRYLTCVVAGKEQFATLDLMELALHTGKMEYLKFGACPSYLIRGQNLTRLEMGALPLGMFDNLPTRPQSLQLKRDDLIVVLSDGVADLRDEHPDRWLRQLLPAVSRHNPQSAAEVILSRARPAPADDDSTVLVVRVI